MELLGIIALALLYIIMDKSDKKRMEEINAEKRKYI